MLKDEEEESGIDKEKSSISDRRGEWQKNTSENSSILSGESFDDDSNGIDKDSHSSHSSKGEGDYGHSDVWVVEWFICGLVQ